MFKMQGLVTLEVVDLLIVLATLIISAGIGVYYCVVSKRYKNTLKGYLLADNKGGIISVSLSVMATYLPAVILLGSPAEAYTYGTQFMMISLVKIFFIFITAYLYFPVYFKMQLISPYQYLEKRFNYNIRCVASFFSSIITLFSTGVTLFIPSLALKTLTSISLESSIIIISVVCSFYSVMGGMRAVIITDVFQAIIMYASLIFIILVSSFEDGGGFYNIMENSEKGGRINFFIMDLDPTIRHTFWTTVLGGGFNLVSVTVCLETQVQRYMIMEKLKDARRTMFLSAVFIAVISSLSFYAGLAVYNTYVNCDPVKAGQIKKYDEIIPFYVRHHLSHIPGATGLFVSGIIASTLSTISSNINSLAAMITEDFIKPLYRLKSKTDCPDMKVLFYAKLCALICSIFSTLIAFSFRNSQSILQLTVTFSFCIVSPLLGIFTLGMFFPFVKEKGALYGFLSGTILIMWIALGPKPPLVPLPMSTDGCVLNSTVNYANDILNVTDIPVTISDVHYPYIYRISYLWHPIIGFLLTLFIGLIISAVEKYFVPSDENKDIDYDLFSPPLASYLKKRNENHHAYELANSRMQKEEEEEFPVSLPHQ